ncbi:hypothetical protein EVAR_75112_1 [Eumeta japonica]|uniref:Uncharacterized protein n=1 Tax=Eumeta variegata TaxID=151549 RepID=A0A4C1U0P8_EUMVA|nr:hypothetical protein EVAR_75112_1 [Eumeta japonica]
MNIPEVHEDMKKEADIRTISWKFIPPGAVNMGGAWKCLVRSVKTALAATIRERSLRKEVIHNQLLEAEHIVNSRPLTEVDIEPTEAKGLTTNHFLIGRSCGAAHAVALTTCSLDLQTGENVNACQSLLAEAVEEVLTYSCAPLGARRLYISRVGRGQRPADPPNHRLTSYTAQTHNRRRSAASHFKDRRAGVIRSGGCSMLAPPLHSPPTHGSEISPQGPSQNCQRSPSDGNLAPFRPQALQQRPSKKTSKP